MVFSRRRRYCVLPGENTRRGACVPKSERMTRSPSSVISKIWSDCSTLASPATYPRHPEASGRIGNFQPTPKKEGCAIVQLVMEIIDTALGGKIGSGGALGTPGAVQMCVCELKIARRISPHGMG